METKNGAGVEATTPRAATPHARRLARLNKRTAAARGGHTVARALGFPPDGRRRKWLLVVAECPFCGHSHGHYGPGDGCLRLAHCGGGWYHVAPGRPGSAVAA